MTDSRARRVVIINNINSDTIDQAIFILKSDKKDRGGNQTCVGGDIVREAQNIINSYVRQVERLKGTSESRVRNRKKTKRRISLGAVLSLVAGLASILLIVGYMIR